MNETASSRRKVTTRVNDPTLGTDSAGQRGAAARRPRPASVDVGRPPGELVVLVVGRDGRAVGQPGLADQQHQLARAAAPAPRSAAARARPTTPRAARGAIVSAGFSSTSTEPPRRAPSARPTTPATRRGAPPASGPSASRTMHRTDRLWAASVGNQPQRPARRLELERQPPVVGRRSRPAAPRTRRGWASRAGGARRARRRRPRWPRPAARTGPRARRPSTWAGSQGPRARMPADTATPHTVPGYGSERWSGGASTGAGATRTSSPRPTELRDAARVPRRAPRLRLARARAAGAAGGGLAAGAAPAPARRRSSEICSTDDYERALHAYGRSYRDIVRAFRGRFDHPPDVVAHPRDEAEVQAVLDWARRRGRGRDPVRRRHERRRRRRGRRAARTTPGVVTIDLKALDRVLEVDPVSLAARIQAGATGPAPRGAARTSTA